MGTTPRHRTGHRDRRRAGVTTFVLALSAALVFPGMASAEPGPDPLIVNDCDATFQGKPGKPVTLDAGSILQVPGILTIGLGNDAEGTNGNEEPVVVVPLKEGVDGLGLSDATLVKDVTGQTCGTVKEAGNAGAVALQSAIPGDDLLGSAPGDKDPEKPTDPEPGDPESGEPEPGDPEPKEPDDPDTPAPGDDENASGVTAPGSIGDGLFDPAFEDLFIPAGSFEALEPLTVPPLAELPPVKTPVQAPELSTPETGKQPNVVAENSGTAEALPESNPPERLPLLLAVLGLVIVAALLARAWMHARKTT